MADALLELHALTKRFDGLTVIDGISLAVPPRSRTALIGPNGAGKTMLFNLITGIYPATAGTIRLGGTDLTTMPSADRVRHGLARTFQNIRLIGHLTALENVLLGQQHRAGGLKGLTQTVLGGSRNHWVAEARAGLHAAGLGRFADVTVRNLPFGVRKQIEVVRAMMARPRLLLLDEPAAGLNPTETNQLKAHLEEIARDGVTLMVIEHDMRFVGEFCDAVVVLNFGRKIAEGSFDDVRILDEVREAYLGGEATVDD